jgi:hypothetical protein
LKIVLPRGLKLASSFAEFMYGLKGLRKKGDCDGKCSESHPSGAKAQSILLALSARLKSCPDTMPRLQRISASCKARWFFAPYRHDRSRALTQCLASSEFPQTVKPVGFLRLIGTTEVVPLHNASPSASFSANCKALTLVTEPSPIVRQEVGQLGPLLHFVALVCCLSAWVDLGLSLEPVPGLQAEFFPSTLNPRKT